MKKAAVTSFVQVVFLFALAATANAQRVFPAPTPTPPPRATPTPPPTAQSTPCPTVTVQPQPVGNIRDGQRVNFSVNLMGGDPKVIPSIVWSTTAGQMTQAQDPRRIDVDTAGVGNLPERELRADVWVGGYAPECTLQASATVKIIAPAAKFGEFGEVSPETLDRHIKTLVDVLSQLPASDNLYLIAYAGRKSERGFTGNWIKRIKDGLVSAGIPAGRIFAHDGGFREQPVFDFWIVPSGADPPRSLR